MNTKIFCTILLVAMALTACQTPSQEEVEQAVASTLAASTQQAAPASVLLAEAQAKTLRDNATATAIMAMALAEVGLGPTLTPTSTPSPLPVGNWWIDESLKSKASAWVYFDMVHAPPSTDWVKYQMGYYQTDGIWYFENGIAHYTLPSSDAPPNCLFGEGAYRFSYGSGVPTLYYLKGEYVTNIDAQGVELHECETGWPTSTIPTITQ